MVSPHINGSRRRNIMFVIGSLDVGGTERHLSQIAPALAQRGYRVCIFCLSHAGPLADDLVRDGVDVIHPVIDSRRTAGSCKAVRAVRWVIVGAQLVAAMLKRRLALVHCLLPAGNIAGAYAARLAFVSAVITSRRSLNLYQRNAPFFAKVERASYKLANAIVANSNASASELVNLEHVPAARVRVIHNGLDPDRFAAPITREQARQTLQLDRDALVFLMSANLKGYKAHAVLIEALRQNLSRLPNWLLLLAGRDDGEGSTIVKLSSQAGFADRVRMLGERRDMPMLLRAADVGVLSSREEGFPNAIIEYMVAGLPVVTTAAGGSIEAVVDGETGVIVPVDDAAKLGDGLVRLASDPGLRLRMGQAGRRRAVQLFSLDACVDAYIALYRELGVTG
jgi:glycosyltransferase involved in cell wall biosynthesis